MGPVSRTWSVKDSFGQPDSKVSPAQVTLAFVNPGCLKQALTLNVPTLMQNLLPLCIILQQIIYENRLCLRLSEHVQYVYSYLISGPFWWRLCKQFFEVRCPKSCLSTSSYVTVWWLNWAGVTLQYWYVLSIRFIKLPMVYWRLALTTGYFADACDIIIGGRLTS